MSQPKAKTLAARFGFQDSDLKTPQHDKLMLMLDAGMDRALEALAFIQQPKQDTWSDADICEALQEHPQSRPDAPLPPRKPYVAQKRWEHPIATGKDNAYVVGFVDMFVTVKRPTRLGTYRNRRGERIWDTLPATTLVAFEVKPKILSIGETIRQIRYYQQYKASMNGSLAGGSPHELRFVVVSYDRQFADVLVAQGIHFLQSEEDGAWWTPEHKVQI